MHLMHGPHELGVHLYDFLLPKSTAGCLDMLHRVINQMWFPWSSDVIVNFWTIISVKQVSYFFKLNITWGFTYAVKVLLEWLRLTLRISGACCLHRVHLIWSRPQWLIWWNMLWLMGIFCHEVRRSVKECIYFSITGHHIISVCLHTERSNIKKHTWFLFKACLPVGSFKNLINLPAWSTHCIYLAYLSTETLNRHALN